MLIHGVPWQAAITAAIFSVFVFAFLCILSVILSYFSIHYVIVSAIIFSSFGDFIIILPLFLNLSRSYFSIIFILYILEIFTILISFGFLHGESGMLDSNGDLVTGFANGLYFSITTFTTLGYGDLKPLPEMRFATSIQALFGMVAVAIGASVLWLWCNEQILPKELAFHDGNRRLKNGLSVHRMKVRTITGKDIERNEFQLPPRYGESYRWDQEREEFVKIEDKKDIKDGDLVVQRSPPTAPNPR